MTLEEPSQKEVDEAIEYIRELRNDPPGLTAVWTGWYGDCFEGEKS